MSEYPPESIDMVYSEMKKQFNFIDGLNILKGYALEYFSISIVEVSTLAVRGIGTLSENDLAQLKKLGWSAGNAKDCSWADYDELKYVDT